MTNKQRKHKELIELVEQHERGIMLVVTLIAYSYDKLTTKRIIELIKEYKG
jgi:hypothetical protein